MDQLSLAQERAKQLFHSGFNCAQAVLTSMAPYLEIDENTCAKLSTGFGGGIAKTQQTCGAVTAAVLAISLKYGRNLDDSSEKTGRTYEYTQQFLTEFENEFGSCQCKVMLGLDMSIPEEMEKIKSLNLHGTTCTKAVLFAVSKLEKIISKE